MLEIHSNRLGIYEEEVRMERITDKFVVQCYSHNYKGKDIWFDLHPIYDKYEEALDHYIEATNSGNTFRIINRQIKETIIKQN